MTRAGEQPESLPKPQVDRKARLQIPAHRPAKQVPEDRISNWDETYFLFDADTARAEAERCIQCPAAPCQKACPVSNDIPGALNFLERGEFDRAAEVFRATSELPEFCGRLCPQERLCEGHCVVGKHALPVAIGKLETFVTEWQQENGTADTSVDASSGRRVAVVGSGPAGIGCAERLARAGHAVTIYEAWPEPGGVLLYGIPTFKQNKAAVTRKFELLQSLGVEVVAGTRIGQDVTLETLQDQFDAVFLGYGASDGADLRIPNEDAHGVYEATEFLVRLNLHGDTLPAALSETMPSMHRVVVVGGGDTSMDCVRSARRAGAEDVRLVYRRTEREMQGRSEERQHAAEEGVTFEYLTTPLEILTDEDGAVRGLRCQRMRLGEPDDTGRARPEPEPGSEFDLEADVIVIAIGYNVDPAWGERTPDLVRDRWERVVVDPETMKTNLEGVFAGGDNVNGADLVVTALADGHKAADGIHAFLNGEPW
ncbi:MAG: NAD(P)-dependent oxidoreductase [Dehalococcoidia bacterium]